MSGSPESGQGWAIYEYTPLVTLLTCRDLLLRAKHLFVAAMADDVHIVLHLDRAARLERDRRRRGRPI
jgi:hypothetical protein